MREERPTCSASTWSSLPICRRRHLLYTDILLQRAACHLGFWCSLSEPERLRAGRALPELLAEAGTLIHKLGYARRKDMLTDLRETAGALGAPGAEPTPDPA
jgi:hypothetical protein